MGIGAILALSNNDLLQRVGESPLLSFVWAACLAGSRFQAQMQKEGEIMGKKQEYEEKTERLIVPILEKNRFELVDVEYVKEGGIWYLRAYIDKPGGITVDDCELVSREMNEILDREDYIDDSYIFEVSSPGLLRPLKKEKDYIRNMGKPVEIRTYRAVGHRKEFYGILKAYDDESVTITDEENKDTVFLKSDIALIRQSFDF